MTAIGIFNGNSRHAQGQRSLTRNEYRGALPLISQVRIMRDRIRNSDIPLARWHDDDHGVALLERVLDILQERVDIYTRYPEVLDAQEQMQS